METKGRLLVVDDDRAIRKLLERIARRAGFEADGARDGVEALEMLDRGHYDVALIDLMMPRLSGYELVARLELFDRHAALGDEFGRAEAEPLLLGAGGLARGVDQQWYAGQERPLADPVDHGEAVQLGEGQIENEQRRDAFRERLDGGLAG